MAIKILINGAFGRMGQMTSQGISNNPDFELVGQTGREYDLAKSIADSGADVVIDFTSADSAFENATTIIKSKVHPVIGTSGLTLDQVKKLQEMCAKENLGGIVAPNFSIGALLMMRYAKEIVRYMPRVEIIEMHHDQKVDSPSGTAVRSAEILSQAIEMSPIKESKETLKGARGADYHGVAIHSIRLPGLLAHQQIIFGELGETLTLRHDSIDRQCFMPGIELACKKVMGLKQLVYGLENVLD